MKLAVVPALLLCLSFGSWQLLAAVDKFVLLDDVNFIKRGWVNRNRILCKGREHLFHDSNRRSQSESKDQCVGASQRHELARENFANFPASLCARASLYRSLSFARRHHQLSKNQVSGLSLEQPRDNHWLSEN